MSGLLTLNSVIWKGWVYLSFLTSYMSSQINLQSFKNEMNWAENKNTISEKPTFPFEVLSSDVSPEHVSVLFFF